MFRKMSFENRIVYITTDITWKGLHGLILTKKRGAHLHVTQQLNLKFQNPIHINF